MARRTLVLFELLLLLAILVWIGVVAFDGQDRPTGAVDLKVQLEGAEDRVWLQESADGALLYRITLDGGVDELLSPEQFARRVYDDQRARGFWEVLLNVSSPAGFAWVLLGLLGQVLFTGRMLVQWLVSERSGRSVVPPAFWWMSLVGATMLLVYFVWRKEPIGVLGQATGWFIYVRNLWMIHRPGGPAVAAQPPGAAESAVGP